MKEGEIYIIEVHICGTRNLNTCRSCFSFPASRFSRFSIHPSCSSHDPALAMYILFTEISNARRSRQCG